jgi:hypothetical protein
MQQADLATTSDVVSMWSRLYQFKQHIADTDVCNYGSNYCTAARGCGHAWLCLRAESTCPIEASKCLQARAAARQAVMAAAAAEEAAAAIGMSAERCRQQQPQ